jgi:hypothetical protein
MYMSRTWRASSSSSISPPPFFSPRSSSALLPPDFPGAEKVCEPPPLPPEAALLRALGDIASGESSQVPFDEKWLPSPSPKLPGLFGAARRPPVAMAGRSVAVLETQRSLCPETTRPTIQEFRTRILHHGSSS